MTAPIRVLLTGKDGQLGQALQSLLPAGVELVATGRQELDLADATACREAVERVRPDWVLNAGAYTAVDRAESEADLAMAINAAAPGAFADALKSTGGRLWQVSTDFVFNGEQGHPYGPEQPLHPLGVYGATKARGETLVRQILGPEASCILRTSWVYGPVGKNFCLTMLRLHRLKAEAGEVLGVVADQVGCPSSTPALAAACWAGIMAEVRGVHHWSDAGAASWYDFAVAIGELGTNRGLLDASAQVRPLRTADYPTPARRPSYSLLDCSSARSVLGVEALHWREALRRVMEQIG